MRRDEPAWRRGCKSPTLKDIDDRNGPESCGRLREESVEALTGERAGQPSSFASIFQMPTVSTYREGNTGGISTVAVPA